MTNEDTRTLFGKNFLGPEELAPHFAFTREAPAIPFSEEVLSSSASTHLLIFTPATETLLMLRERFGLDPAVSEPCFYNQDWYLKEDFVSQKLDGGWHLIRKEVLEDARAKNPTDIEAGLSTTEKFPTAATLAFVFFAYWLTTGGEVLWKHDFLWASDLDHNGDRIYVGRYQDPDGVNKNGFNIHRHLALRPAYSAAPEITS